MPVASNSDPVTTPRYTFAPFDPAVAVRHDWSAEDILGLLTAPLLDLVYHAATVHRHFNIGRGVQKASLLSIKTGGCPEDCGYCPQSAHHDTALKREPLLTVDEVRVAAERAKSLGATRFCMGAAWRQVKDGPDFDRVLDMVRTVRRTGLEACVTLGMLTESQARRLADAGLTAYNHNLDTSPEFYGQIIHTRTYEDRLRTLEHVRQAGVSVCCGGIIGMGETDWDRARLLQVLASMRPHPESVPVNALVAVPGTPLANTQPVQPVALIRMCATARILMPTSRVRLSAGRTCLSKEAQYLCFLAGADSIFYGDKLLTTPNPSADDDQHLLAEIGEASHTA